MKDTTTVTVKEVIAMVDCGPHTAQILIPAVAFLWVQRRVLSPVSMAGNNVPSVPLTHVIPLITVGASHKDVNYVKWR